MLVPETEIIVTVEGGEVSRVVLPPGEYLVGRGGDCAIQVIAGLVSRRHARVTLSLTGVQVEDLQSANGTFVQNKLITGTVRLWPNQKVVIGSATLEFRRKRAPGESSQSLPPQVAAVRRYLPEDFLRTKKYDIGKVVARGGMGAIIDAKEATIDRAVAMKVMLHAARPEELARFVTEARVTAQLEHPNIVPVHELGVDENDQVFYTMKFVRGITLRKVLELLAGEQAGTIAKYPLGQLLTVFQKVCDALAFAHSKGVIHRDLKPDNIMIGDFGEVLVMDWGLARRLGTPDDSGGIILGTPQYMAPEQARGEIETLDARADVFALGCMLHHLLALAPPVVGTDSQDVVDRMARGDFAPPSAATRGSKRLPHLPGGRVPESLDAVVRKALALEPEERYQNVPELQADVEAFQNGFATSAEQAGFVKQLALLARRHRIASFAAFAVLLLAMVFAVYAVSSQQAMTRNLAHLKNTAPTFHAQALATVERAPVQPDALTRALGHIERALIFSPQVADYHAVRGQILQTLQRLAEARASFAQALKLDPQHTGAQANLALCDELLKTPVNQPTLSAAGLRRLQGALQQQGRAAEAIVLRRAFGKEDEQLVAKAQAALRNERIDRPVSITEDGSLLLNLDGLAVNDLTFLRGLPIGDLSLRDTKVRDLAPLARMPLRRLMLSNAPISDLEPLSGLPLVELTLNGTRVTSLRPLRNLPLEKLDLGGLSALRDPGEVRSLPLKWLNISGLRLPNLKLLADLKLEFLNISANQCSDLAPLGAMPLHTFIADNCGALSDLTPLAGRPLESVKLNRTSVRDLTPLQGAPLETLELADTPVADLAALRKFRQLRTLHLAGTRVNDLTPLAGLPVETLSLDRCLALRDLAPLTELKQLALVSLPLQPNGLSALQQLPGLRWIGFGQPMLSTEREIKSALNGSQAADFLRVFEEFETMRRAAPEGRIRAGQFSGFATLFPGATRFAGSWYLSQIGTISWTQAQEQAGQLGGHLAVVTSPEEDGFLAKSFLSRSPAGRGLWLGGRTDRPSGPWRWVTGETWLYQHWGADRPDARASSEGSETHLAIFNFQSNEPAWEDCADTAAAVSGFLIEWAD